MSDQNILYRFYAASGELLYVGITNDPWRRFSQHRADKEWWRDVSNICQQHFTTREELSAAESRAISSENPRHNIRSKNCPPVEPIVPQKNPHGLAGRWFHSWAYVTEEDDTRDMHIRKGRAVEWQGQILNQVTPERYLIQLYSWWDGCPTEQRLVGIDDMCDWTFYSSNIEMIASLGCSDCDSYVPAEYFSAINGLGQRALCPSCATHWSNARPIIWRDNIAQLGDKTVRKGVLK